MTSNVTDLYIAHLETEAAFAASPLSMEAMNRADAAYNAWLGAISAERAKWVAVPASDAKSSAETNAEDTEGCDVDELRWLQIANGTYQMNIDSGDYNADGSSK